MGLVAVTATSYALVAAEMASLSPYEYTYFSPLVGGLRGPSGQYETDYYGTCAKEAVEWLGQNYHRYTSAPAPTVDALSLMQPVIAVYLPAAFHEDSAHPDFFIGFTRFNDNLRYPAYRMIHAIAVEGVTLCMVKANPATTGGP